MLKTSNHGLKPQKKQNPNPKFKSKVKGLKYRIRTDNNIIERNFKLKQDIMTKRMEEFNLQDFATLITQFYENILQTINVGIIIVDNKFNVLYNNNQACELLQKEKSQLMNYLLNLKISYDSGIGCHKLSQSEIDVLPIPIQQTQRNPESGLKNVLTYSTQKINKNPNENSKFIEVMNEVLYANSSNEEHFQGSPRRLDRQFSKNKKDRHKFLTEISRKQIWVTLEKLAFFKIIEDLKYVNEDVLIISCELIDQSLLLRELGQMNDFKSRLICSVSHEIKTPLNCSISLLGIALDSEDIPSSFKESLLFPTYCNNYVLLSIINDILDFASIDLGKFKFSFHQFNIENLIQDAINLVSFQASQKKIDVYLDTDPFIRTEINSDSQRIHQIMLNLLMNALKYTKKGIIEVLISQSNNPDEIQIKVKDTGCGIEQSKINNILETFGKNLRKAQASLDTKGGGLGLTISNYLAKGLSKNKSIQIESKVGIGSSFTFYIYNNKPDKKESVYKKIEQYASNSFQWTSKSINSIQFSQELGHQKSNYQSLQLGGKIDIFSRIYFNHNIKESSLYQMDQRMNRDLQGQVDQEDQSKYTHLKVQTQFKNSEEEKEKDSKEEKLNSSCEVENSERQNSHQIQSPQGSNINPVTNVQSLKHELDQIVADRSQDNKILASQRSKIMKSQPKWTNSSIQTIEMMHPNTKQQLQKRAALFPCDCSQILIVDDNAVNIYSLKLVLRDYRFRLEGAESGQKAINLVKQRSHDQQACCKTFKLILMDLDMPGIDGFAATDQIITILNDKCLTSFICACTAYDGMDEQTKARETGFDDFISKPVGKSTIELLLRRVFLND